MNNKELQEINRCNNVIDRLIFSNMQQESIDGPLYINFGVYRLTYKAEPKCTLKDAVKYFKKEITKITKDWDF